MKTLIIIPAYNEEENIKKVVENIIYHFPQYDYIIVNDGSIDSTAEICKSENYAFLKMCIRDSTMMGPNISEIMKNI